MSHEHCRLFCWDSNVMSECHYNETIYGILLIQQEKGFTDSYHVIDIINMLGYNVAQYIRRFGVLDHSTDQMYIPRTIVTQNWIQSAGWFDIFTC